MCGFILTLKNSGYDIMREEQWPHLSVLKKYAKRVTFTAGETRTILMMKDMAKAVGRLWVLLQLAHWTCACKNWGLVWGLYEAIIESIELGEAEWTSNLEHFKSRVPVTVIYQETKELRNTVGKEKEKKEKREETSGSLLVQGVSGGTCTETVPHMASIKPEEPPVPVLHVCATR